MIRENKRFKLGKKSFDLKGERRENRSGLRTICLMLHSVNFIVHVYWYIYKL